ncbi:MAG: beta-ketoacyl-[acyl-carrier-protein] synthase II [Gammaproteobacteria bacterium]|nr:MAG: beta-ketoacyl-[acyl-carrier-protein] synthase II [Gammaproteobacteria bacterium]
MSKRRVVITGVGMVSPIGLDVGENWKNVTAGVSGIAPLTEFDVSAFSVRFGGSVKEFDVTEYMSAKDARKMDTFIHYGFSAASQAIRDAGLTDAEPDAERIGVAIGSGIGGLPGIESGHAAFLKSGPRKISPFFVPSNIINMVSGNVSVAWGFQGPNIALVSACASATHSIGDAARLIEYGDADVMVAGGAEKATSATGLGGFAAARALSTRNDDPQGASRPWDRDRDGFVLSDGAGVLVLEEYEHAKARDASIYAEIVGYGLSGDAYHMTNPEPNGDGAYRCMKLALKNAGLNPDQVDYINAHGTSTPAGDVVEVKAIKRTFGDHAHRLAVSSTKSMTGHLLGAAGGIEAVYTALALKNRVAPPTINLDNPEEGCDLDFVAHTARDTSIDVAMSNSFGFGGTNATLIFKRS